MKFNLYITLFVLIFLFCSLSEISNRKIKIHRKNNKLSLHKGVGDNIYQFVLALLEEIMGGQDFSNSNENSTSHALKINLPEEIPRPGCVAIYDDVQFKGKAKELCGNVKSLNEFGLNKKVKSIKVSNGSSAVFYSKDDYTGELVKITKSYADLKDMAFSEIASSVKLYGDPMNGCAILYKQAKFEGSYLYTCSDIKDSTEKGFNSFSSLKISSNMFIEIFSGSNFSGDKAMFNKNEESFLEQKTLSLEIREKQDVKSNDSVAKKMIDSCLPDEWKQDSAINDIQKTTDSSIGNQESSSIWDKIGGAIGATVDLLCIGKDLVSGLMKFFVDKAKTLIRRRRMFISRKKNHFSFSSKNWFTDAFNTVTSIVKDVSKNISNGIADTVSTISDGISKTIDFVGQGIDFIADKLKKIVVDIIDSVMDSFNSIKAKITSYFDSPLFKYVKQFLNCIKNMKKSIKSFTALIEGFLSKALNLLNFPVGWISVLFDLICNWRDFKQAIDYLLKGIKASGSAKWGWIGKFLGKLIYTLGAK